MSFNLQEFGETILKWKQRRTAIYEDYLLFNRNAAEVGRKWGISRSRVKDIVKREELERITDEN